MSTQSLVFDRAAGFYDETRGFPPGVEQPVAELIAQTGKLTAGSQVLEIGVGTGRIALPLTPLVGAYIGIDLAMPMMARLEEKQADTPKRVRLAQADASRLPFASGAFDAGVAVHVFHLIANWREALSELTRVLRPGAPLLHCWSRRSPLAEQLRSVQNAALPPRDQEAVGIRQREVPTFLADVGWRAISDEQVHEYSVTFTPQDFVTQLEQRIWSRTWQLSDEELARTVAETQTFVNRSYSDPHAPVSGNASFHVQAYLPPR